MADLAVPTPRQQRSRAACTHCRQHKQKCDGPSRNPCRRCELYQLECTYPIPVGLPTTILARAATSASAPVVVSRSDTDTLVDDQLREISDRLRSIESSLSNGNLSVPTQLWPSAVHSTDSSFPRLHSGLSASPTFRPEGAPSSSSSSFSQGQQSRGAVNAVLAVSETVDFIASLRQHGTDFEDLSWLLDDLPPDEGPPRSSTSLNGPDVLDRGIMSVEEVEFTFDIFHRLLSPWLFIFDRQRDTDAMTLRDRSPLLFHVVLLSTTYYRIGSSARAASIYNALMGIVNELIAPMLISTQPYHLKPDLVRALCMMMLYKPVQFAELYAAGITDPIAAEQASKLNGTSSSTIWNLMIRTAHTLNLASIPYTFSKTYQPNVAVPPAILNELRLWAWLVVVDTHGCLTTGRASSVDPTDLLRVTRIFSLLKSQIGDVRLAATVELYAIARDVISAPWYTIVGGTGKRTPAYELRKFNRDVDEWEAFWGDKLNEAAQEGDALAATVVCTFANFMRVIINSSVFTRWRNDRKESLSRGGDGRPEFLEHDWQFIQVVLDSTERLLFSVSIESRVEGSFTKRAVQWPALREGQSRAPLTLDETIIDSYKTAIDAVTCIVYVYPLVLAAKMVNAGLIRCEFDTQTARVEYEARASLDKPRHLSPGTKLGVLLELGAKFLDANAPTSSHPVRRHARMLRAILVAGTMGQSTLDRPQQDQFRSQSVSAMEPMQTFSSGVASPLPDVLSSSTTSSDHPIVFKLPSGAIHEPTQDYHPQHHQHQRAMDAGQALASVLAGIKGSYFGSSTVFGDAKFEEDLCGTDGMSVDWESLEKSLDYDGFVAGGLSFGGSTRF